MESFEIEKYLEMALRRKYWIIILFLLSILGGLSFFLVAPRIYEATTLFLVQPQRVPEEFVRSIVSTSVEDRVRTISEQVTSRTNLEKIIEEFRLLDSDNSHMSIDSMVAGLRKRIKIDVKGERGRVTSMFTIAFRDKNPETAMKVTNALASNFVSENLKIREAQALGTSIFLADELESVKKQLMEKESELAEYRERYMGGLPEQLRTNLSILERLQLQQDQLNNNLRDAENRKILIQTQLTEQTRQGPKISNSQTIRNQDDRDIQSLRNELASLEGRYTGKHPDVVRLRETIANLERERAEADPAKPGSIGKNSPLSSVDSALRRQYQDLDLETKNLKAEIKKIQSQIGYYEKKVEETPKREQELLSLNRDYENLREVYNSLLGRKLEAGIAVSMEKKQKGEQFRVIDPAKVPTEPVSPDMRKILLMTLALGLGLGCGLAYLMEMMDSSYKSPDELEQELKIPVLINVPFFYTRKEQRNRRIKEFLKAASVSVGFVLSAVGIVFTLKGVDNTMNFVKNILEKI